MGKGVLLTALALLLAMAPTRLTAQMGGITKLAPGLKDLEQLQKEFKDIDKVAKDLADKSKKGQDFLEKEPFTKDDVEDDPDLDPNGQPQLPSTCKDNDECAACFKKPYADLQSTRYRFEKLRGLYHHTVTGITDAIAFGDNMASLAGGMASLAWMKEKEGIQESRRNLDTAYDNKYEELVATLKGALDGIAACEEKVFGEEAWYDRYGFIYYQFMADRYRRQ